MFSECLFEFACVCILKLFYVMMFIRDMFRHITCCYCMTELHVYNVLLVLLLYDVHLLHFVRQHLIMVLYFQC